MPVHPATSNSHPSGGDGAATKLQAEGDLQPVTMHEGGIGKDFTGGAIGLDAPLVEDQDPRAKIENHLEVMRRNKLGRLTGLEDPDELSAGAGVEVARGLIESEQVGFAGEDSREADPFSFAATQLQGGP